MQDRLKPSQGNPICPPPEPDGLYDPQFEHDACGVGMICHIKGEASHDIVRNALQILENLAHRGACGCDATTGDGAGILIQLPHALLAKVGADAGFDLPGTGQYGAGLVFLPPDDQQNQWCRAQLESVVREEGQVVLGWRRVPINPEKIGDLARSLQPAIWQIF